MSYIKGKIKAKEGDGKESKEYKISNAIPSAVRIRGDEKGEAKVK